MHLSNSRLRHTSTFSPGFYIWFAALGIPCLIARWKRISAIFIFISLLPYLAFAALLHKVGLSAATSDLVCICGYAPIPKADGTRRLGPSASLLALTDSARAASGFYLGVVPFFFDKSNGRGDDTFLIISSLTVLLSESAQPFHLELRPNLLLAAHMHYLD